MEIDWNALFGTIITTTGGILSGGNNQGGNFQTPPFQYPPFQQGIQGSPSLLSDPMVIGLIGLGLVLLIKK